MLESLLVGRQVGRVLQHRDELAHPFPVGVVPKGSGLTRGGDRRALVLVPEVVLEPIDEIPGRVVGHRFDAGYEDVAELLPVVRDQKRAHPGRLVHAHVDRVRSRRCCRDD